jgi:hypothetical protein
MFGIQKDNPIQTASDNQKKTPGTLIARRMPGTRPFGHLKPGKEGSGRKTAGPERKAGKPPRAR